MMSTEAGTGTIPSLRPSGSGEPGQQRALSPCSLGRAQRFPYVSGHGSRHPSQAQARPLTDFGAGTAAITVVLAVGLWGTLGILAVDNAFHTGTALGAAFGGPGLACLQKAGSENGHGRGGDTAESPASTRAGGLMRALPNQFHI